MVLLAHGESGSGWGTIFEPWEMHSILIHFPIAFLLSAVVLDLYGRWRGTVSVLPVAAGLLVAGVVIGVLAALAGVLAFFTVPAHTMEAHRLMYWHLGIQSAALALFIWPAWAMWRDPVGCTLTARVIGWVAAILLIVGSGVGGYIVYHGGAGVEPMLLTPEVRENHEHETH